jgi:chromosomal replication initiation ATPase DnaA
MSEKTAEDKINYLFQYRWSSLPGYIGGRKDRMVECGMVLGEYGGDNDQGRREYKKRIELDIASGLEIKTRMLVQSMFGGSEFVISIKEKFVKGKKDRESPAHRELKRYKAEDEIAKVIEQETGISFEEITMSRGVIRWMTMDILYRIGGMKGIKIGEIFKVDYSTVSQGRKRLREQMEKNAKLRNLVQSIEERLSK